MNPALSDNKENLFYEKMLSPGFGRAWARRFRAPEIEG
jgi:hypothetical protein